LKNLEDMLDNRGKKGHYCLSVKKNQSNLYKDIDEYFRFDFQLLENLIFDVIPNACYFFYAVAL